MVQTISWFIESDGKLQRVEEELVAISDKELSFARKGEKYVLKSDLSIAPYVFGDVVFMVQQGPALAPIRLPFSSGEALLSQEEIEEIVSTQVRDLEAKVDANRETIRRMLREKSETLDPQFKIFDQLAEFRQFLKEKVVELVGEKVEQQKQMLEAQKVVEPAPVRLPAPVQPPTPVVAPPTSQVIPPVAPLPPAHTPAPVITEKVETPPPVPPADTTYTKDESSYRMFFNIGGKKRWT